MSKTKPYKRKLNQLWKNDFWAISSTPQCWPKIFWFRLHLRFIFDKIVFGHPVLPTFLIGRKVSVLQISLPCIFISSSSSDLGSFLDFSVVILCSYTWGIFYMKFCHKMSQHYTIRLGIRHKLLIVIIKGHFVEFWKSNNLYTFTLNLDKIQAF